MNIEYNDQDDPGFVDIVAVILDSVLLQCEPNMACVIQIDNWFDHKWLKFSGIGNIQLGCWDGITTLPPFNPNRVKAQSVFELDRNGEYGEIEAPLIHLKQNSGANIDNHLEANTNSGMFAWWSSNTKLNGKGSLMVYTQVGKKQSSWFASFDEENGWRVNKVKCIPMEALKAYMEGRTDVGVSRAKMAKMTPVENQSKATSRRVFKPLLKSYADSLNHTAKNLTPRRTR